MLYRIDQELCSKCKHCIEVCPNNIIELKKSGNVSFIPERTEICLHCGQCMAICKTKAIQVDGLNYEEDFIELPKLNINYQEFMDFLANRRSIRNYKDKLVSDELINKILDSLSFAPFGAEPNKVHIKIVNDRDVINSALPHIEKFLFNIVKWMENPIASFMIKRKNGVEKFNTIKNHLYPIAKSGNYKLKYGDRITRDAPAIIILHSDKSAEEHTNNAIIYSTYITLATHSLGLGATMVGLVPPAINRVPKVKKIFQIPDQHEAIMSVIIGYPKYKYQRSIVRRNKVIERKTK